MTERNSFDDRLSTAVRSFADRARTQVDAVEMADRAMTAGGRARGPRSTRTLLSAPVWLLLLLALLLALTVALGVGGNRDDRGIGVVPPSPTPTATATPTAGAGSVSPSAAPDPLREAYVSGSPLLTLVAPGQSSQTGEATRVAGIVYDLQDAVDDPRVAGSGSLSLDTSGTAAGSFGSGSIQIQGPDGSWDGTCTSASWPAEQSLSLSCWLSGTGAYQGLTYHRYSLTSDAGNAFEGVVMSAPQPSPQPSS